MSGRPTIAPLVDRPGKNFSIILTNHGRFGLFSASVKFERGRPRWILSDSRSTWKIQIVSKSMQNASNVSMWGGADRCSLTLQGTACVRILTYPLFLQWARGQVLLILPRIGRIGRMGPVVDVRQKQESSPVSASTPVPGRHYHE